MSNDAKTNTSGTSTAPAEKWVPHKDPVIRFILALHLAYALAFSFVMELGHAPDELSRHYPYVRFLAHNWRLPVGDPGTEGGHLDIHPPLYYALLTPVYLLTEGMGDEAAMRALRLTSPPLVLIVLLLWLPVITAACGGRRGSTLFAFALTAWWPHLFVPAGALNNDVGLLLMSALLVWLVAVRHREDRSVRTALVWGLVAGLGTLMKTSALPPALAVITIGLLCAHGRSFFRDGQFWKRLVAAFVVCGLVCAWWLVRNFFLYGQLSPVPPGYSGIPTGVGKLEALFMGLWWPLFARALDGLWTSIWAQVGWFPDWAKIAVYRPLLAVTVLAAVGLIAGAIRLHKGRIILHKAQRTALWVACGGFILLAASAVYVAVFVHLGVYQGGRYLLAYLPGLTIMLTLGLRQVVPARWQIPLGIAFLAFIALLSPLACYHIETFWNLVVRGEIPIPR